MIKHSRRKTGSAPGKPPASAPKFPYALWGFVCLAALAASFYLYGPSLNGAFVFDDLSLPFAQNLRDEPLLLWVSGVRPVLMFTYWLNRVLWGDGPFSYHVVNLLIHVCNTGLVFLVLLRLLQLAGWIRQRALAASAVGAVVFLVHPLQTESVSYIAGRSESLAALFLLLAYAAFLYRRHDAITWREAVAVMVLFGLGIATKENAVSLAGIFVLTDLFWQDSMRGPRRNWRLYALMIPGAVVGAAAVLRMLATAPSAGFSLRAFTWYQYAFTQARAVFTYARLALFPIGQSIDHDYPVSHSITEHGAILWMALLAALVAAAVVFRRRYPLFAFGLLMSLIWLAPTSSVVPINDVLVERRMYLPMIGLILIGCEAAGRLKVSRPAGYGIVTVILMVYGGFCFARNQLYGQPEKLFGAAAMESSHKPRPYAVLADLLIAGNRCSEAIPYLEHADRLFPADPLIDFSWGRILECTGQGPAAIQRLKRAASHDPKSSVYEKIGLLYGEMQMSDEAGAALHKAVEMDPKSTSAHKALALWYESVHDLDAAEREYRLSLRLARNDPTARLALVRVREMKRSEELYR